MPFFPVAGLILAALLIFMSQVAEFLFLQRTVTPLREMLTALIWLALELVLTRALHWDGLCDLADAVGSGKSGEKFQQVLKDSRLGAFGACALVLVLLGQWLAVSVHLSFGDMLSLLLAPAYARSVPLLLAAGLHSHPNSSLGGSIVRAVRVHSSATGISLCTLFVLPLLSACIYGRPSHLLLIPAEGLLLLVIRQKAAREGGLSGDYFGALIEISQLFFLVLTL